jgi:hypothetical protein
MRGARTAGCVRLRSRALIHPGGSHARSLWTYHASIHCQLHRDAYPGGRWRRAILAFNDSPSFRRHPYVSSPLLRIRRFLACAIKSSNRRRPKSRRCRPFSRATDLLNSLFPAEPSQVWRKPLVADDDGACLQDSRSRRRALRTELNSLAGTSAAARSLRRARPASGPRGHRKSNECRDKSDSLHSHRLPR